MEVNDMAVTIPEKFKDLLTKQAFAHLATLMPDGSPQVTPVWFDYDGIHILINTAKARLKDKNMRDQKKGGSFDLGPGEPLPAHGRAW